MMNNPWVSAVICAAVAAWLAYTIFSPGEASSMILTVTQWVFLLCAVAGVIAAVVRIVRER